jgi:hypothetical protein
MRRSGNVAVVMKYTRKSGGDSEIVLFRRMEDEKGRNKDQLRPDP